MFGATVPLEIMNSATTKSVTPLVISVAPNGARKTKKDHPSIPIEPRELAIEAAAGVETGAAMIHLHVRNASGGHSLDACGYQTAIDAIRAEIGQRIIIQITSEAVGLYQPQEQIAMVREVRPEAVSLAIRELCPPGCDETEVANFFSWILSERIMPQYIMFSVAEVEQFLSLQNRGIIPDEHPFVLFVLGRYSKNQRSSPRDLLPFLGASEGLPMEWSVCAFGAEEARCALAAIALDGHCRVGFENNMLLADGTTSPNNSSLVAQVRDGAMLMHKPIVDANIARALLSQE